ncbi:hypothetical protein [Stenotrophomonas sp. RG-453]|uniref:hypothetical protein n=1 Tax=Stenotrophomonas sp. RG-453 TaxID=2957502 RepID=UPI0029C9CC67|nr:hypothetical protein [Stenotrophomonas sp. RG-453]MDX5516146.1 hypothetical protein [Stenotrophomonas sp. RG-453]
MDLMTSDGMCRLYGKVHRAKPVTHQHTHDGSYTVQLSVEGREYSAELRCDSNAEWTLLSIEVEGTAAQALNWRASSCVDALVAAEALAKQIMEVIADEGSRPKV